MALAETETVEQTEAASARALRAVRRPVSGWGHHPVEECDVYRPERLADLTEVVTRAPQPSLIPRGLGRSYGDAALNADRGVVSCERLDRMLSFDPESGVLACESAVSLADILDHFLPRGFFFPVTPGTKYITIGGAIAADVHGKNHHRDGSMSNFLIEFRLLTAGGEILSCSRDENPDVFWATIGGMGLTGIILDARLQLRPVETAFMRMEVERTKNLDVSLERIFESDDQFAYSVAWIDCLARGGSLGRSVLMRANHASLEDVPEHRRRGPIRMRSAPLLSVPFRLPNVTLNSLSMRLFNDVIYQANREGSRLTGYNRYFYPLDTVGHWNRGYGRRGVLQYQVLLPHETSREGLVAILEELSSARRAVFLAVLKSFGGASEGLLSFPRPGHTLAFDLPNTGQDVRDVLARLDALALRLGGSVYLAKDSCLSAEHFRAMYPRLEAFREVKAKLDPEQRFSSSQARRLGIVDPA